MKCCVDNYVQESLGDSENLSLHSFPINYKIRRAWVTLVRNCSRRINPKKDRICSKHFEESCFIVSGRKQFLRKGSIPTIFPTEIIINPESEDPSAGNISEENVIVEKFSSPRSIVEATTDAKEDDDDNPIGLISGVNIYAAGPSNDPRFDLPGEIFATKDTLQIASSSESSYVKSPPRKKIKPNKITPLYKILKTSSSSNIDEDISVRILRRHRHVLKGVVKIERKRKRKVQQQVRRLKKKVTSLRIMLDSLTQNNLLSQDEYEIIDANCLGKESLTEELFAKVNQKIQSPKEKVKYTQNLRKFALDLNYASPKAYDYVRQQFHCALPHPRPISRWYQTVDGRPGFTKESFNALSQLTEIKRKLVCALSIDEVVIRKLKEFDGKRWHGYVTHGDKDEQEICATQALVYMLVSLNGTWKIPIGYFFINSLRGDQKMNLVVQCLILLNQANVDVATLTFDGATSNISMASLMGCTLNRLENISCTRFEFNEKSIYLFLDAADMIKLVRNTLAETGPFFDGDGKHIDWKFIKMLQELQETEGLHLGNKIRKANINFFKQKMKVRLATQTLSNSVADALEYCTDVLKIPDFNDTEGTVRFIRYINNAFDILNSRNRFASGYKKSICRANVVIIENFITAFLEYPQQIRYSDGTLLWKSKRKVGFIGFLTGLQNVIKLYEEYVQTDRLQYIPTYRISQDHVELLFSTIRSQLGFNNNPSCRQFEASYKRIIVHSQLSDRGLGNCIPLESINILNTSCMESLRDPRIINEDENIIVEEEFEYLNAVQVTTQLSHFVFKVVTYVSGFVTRILKTRIQCEICITALYGNREDFMLSFISQKDRGELEYPSNDVIKVCEILEKCIRTYRHIDCKKLYERIMKLTFTDIYESNIFSNLLLHNLETGPIGAHRYILINCITDRYLRIRLHYIETESEHSIYYRNLLTKLIIFRNQ